MKDRCGLLKSLAQATRPLRHGATGTSTRTLDEVGGREGLQIGIGAPSICSGAPATPPGMRVRTGRFGLLSSRRQAWDA